MKSRLRISLTILAVCPLVWAGEGRVQGYFSNLNKSFTQWSQAPEILTTNIKETTEFFSRKYQQDTLIHTFIRTNSRGIVLTELINGKKASKEFPDYSQLNWVKHGKKYKETQVSLEDDGHTLVWSRAYYVRSGKKYGGIVALKMNVQKVFQQLLREDKEPLRVVWNGTKLFQKNWVDELETEKTHIQLFKGFDLDFIRFKNVVISEEVQSDSVVEVSDDIIETRLSEKKSGGSLHSEIGMAVAPKVLQGSVKLRQWVGWVFLLLGLCAGALFLTLYVKLKKLNYLDYRKLRFYYFSSIAVSIAVVYLSIRVIIQYHHIAPLFMKENKILSEYRVKANMYRGNFPRSIEANKLKEANLSEITLKAILPDRGFYTAVVAYGGKYYHVGKGDVLQKKGAVQSIDVKGMNILVNGKESRVDLF